MNQLLLIVGDKEYRLKATTAAVDAAEKRIGKSLLEALSTIDQMASFAAILWAGLQKFHHGMTMERVYTLIDDIIEQGCEFNGKSYPGQGVEMRMELALEVLKVSGFFTAKEIETMEAAMPAKSDVNSEA
jgi:hypothetical protein